MPIIEKIELPEEIVMNQIYMIREQKVMLDRDLAALYDVDTKVLNQAVRRNLDRFPIDFMFQLTQEEHNSLRSQIVTIKSRGVHSKYLPHVFTEQGIAMLSSVLSSKRAIQVNIQIIRVFTKLRQLLSDHTEVRLEIAEIKQTVHKIMKAQDGQDKNITLLFNYIDRLQEKTDDPKPVQTQAFGYQIGKANKTDLPKE